MSFRPFVIVAALCAGLSACGATTGEQALLGGGAGAIGGAIVGANPVATAIAGAGTNLLYCELNPGRCN
ncbi:MAG: hypothetical protein AAGF74_17695 [Pseudomonadota bacterium]